MNIEEMWLYTCTVRIPATHLLSQILGVEVRSFKNGSEIVAISNNCKLATVG